MFSCIENSNKHEEDSTGFDKKISNETGVVTQLKVQQNTLETQIKDLSNKLFFDKSAKLDISPKPPFQHQIKPLAVELSLNTAEQKALKGEEVESILQPIVATLIKKTPAFSLEAQWVAEKVGYIRKLALINEYTINTPMSKH
jgi:hypothetical protein